MTNDYLVKVTEQAREQLREIAQYIAKELKNPDAILNFIGCKVIIFFRRDEVESSIKYLLYFMGVQM